jgi:small subunit ribosomal protein S19e
MTHPKEVPADKLLPRLAAELRGQASIKPPAWAAFARTGVHTERAPTQADWWYLRSASVLRKLHTDGPRGVSLLSASYGGRRDRGSAPYHARKGSRSIAREVLQQLEKAGLVQQVRLRGRTLTPQGQKLLAKVSTEAFKAMAEKDPTLKKYL